METLSSDERARAARIVDNTRRLQFFAGRYFLRAVLSRYVRVPPAQLVFHYGPNGKPGLDGTTQPVEFSISHSNDVFVCAVARRARVGVDVENAGVLRDFIRLGKRLFPEIPFEEYPEPDRGRLFYEHWTMHEAHVKAFGAGIAAIIHAAYDEVDGSVCRFEPFPGYSAAVVSLAANVAWQWFDFA